MVGSIPARAGETFQDAQCPKRIQVYPRTGGGNRIATPEIVDGRGLSPHGRGKQDTAYNSIANIGSIPARAGETPPALPTASRQWVYPRTGGGNSARLTSG